MSLVDNKLRTKAADMKGERFRASTDIPATKDGLKEFGTLAQKLAAHGGFDEIYHDGQKRTVASADVLKKHMPKAKVVKDERGRAQSLGALEGCPCTPENLAKAQSYVESPSTRPPGVSKHSGKPGETFDEFRKRYFPLVDELHQRAHEKGLKIALVTHNRNIQTENARIAEQGSKGRGLKIDPKVMKDKGPDPGTAHKVIDHATEPWENKKLDAGLYLVRHARTEWN